MSNYPRDEFDKVPENASRQGVHRSTIEPPTHSLVPLITFGVLALVVGVLAFLFLPRLLEHTPTQVAAGVSSTSSTSASSASSATSATGASSPAPATSSAPATSAAPSATAASPSAAAVDKTSPVGVYNNTGIAGLANKYAAKLTADGWQVSQTANWGGATQPKSVVFYATEDQKVNAEALAQALGFGQPVLVNQLGVPLAVVLGPGAS
ncbi:MAG: LytR C-terminal domain-containing protein [Acidobacteria bacterium]|nr:LytR C-terminal domain-containing protein [Acidobacteriota bacterium]